MNLLGTRGVSEHQRLVTVRLPVRDPTQSATAALTTNQSAPTPVRFLLQPTSPAVQSPNQSTTAVRPTIQSIPATVRFPIQSAPRATCLPIQPTPLKIRLPAQTPYVVRPIVQPTRVPYPPFLNTAIAKKKQPTTLSVNVGMPSSCVPPGSALTSRSLLPRFEQPSSKLLQPSEGTQPSLRILASGTHPTPSKTSLAAARLGAVPQSQTILISSNGKSVRLPVASLVKTNAGKEGQSYLRLNNYHKVISGFDKGGLFDQQVNKCSPMPDLRSFTRQPEKNNISDSVENSHNTGLQCSREGGLQESGQVAAGSQVITEALEVPSQKSKVKKSSKPSKTTVPKKKRAHEECDEDEDEPSRKKSLNLKEKEALLKQKFLKNMLEKKTSKFKYWECRICEKIYTSYETAMCHANLPDCKSLNKKKSQPTTCYICDSVFPSKQAATKHYNTMHNESLECSKCPNVEFRDEKALRRHLDTIHGDMKYTCTECGQEFNRKDSRVRHMKIHERNKHENPLFDTNDNEDDARFSDDQTNHVMGLGVDSPDAMETDYEVEGSDHVGYEKDSDVTDIDDSNEMINPFFVDN